MTTITPILLNNFIQFDVLFTSSESNFATLGIFFRQQMWYYTSLLQTPDTLHLVCIVKPHRKACHRQCKMEAFARSNA